MSVEILRHSTEAIGGRSADGYCLIVELFGFVFEFAIARAR